MMPSLKEKNIMSRFVVPRIHGLAAGAATQPDGFAARLAKYLPAEIMSFYTVAIGGLVSAKPDQAVAPLIAVGLMLLFLAATVAYFYFRAPVGTVRRAHLIASPIAFVAWAYPLAAPLLGAWFIGWIAIIGQAIAALVAWLIEPQ
jgi:hypothetical protein